MDTLIIARHGEYDSPEHLNLEGQRQMARLAEHLKPITINRKVFVLASTAGRASESGDILAEVLGYPIEYHKTLWSDGRNHFVNLQEATKLLRGFMGYDVVVVVTHLEYSKYLPPHVGEQMLGVCFSPCREIEKGQAWIIDFGTKELRLINP